MQLNCLPGLFGEQGVEKRRRGTAASEALALLRVRHPHDDRRALIPARFAGLLRVELVLHAPVEAPDALDCKFLTFVQYSHSPLYNAFLLD